MELQIKLDKLIQYELSFEAWFILYCLFNNNEKILIDYIQNCRKIPTEIFNLLEERQLITINRQQLQDNKIVYSLLKITKEGKSLFELPNFDQMFEELRQIYPKRVGGKLDGRPLHSDLKRCKVLYKKIINDDVELHKKICKCALMYHQEKLRTNSEIYMQSLPTWLHQENYKQYIDEVDNYNEIVEQSNITTI
jgi:hypothetical protein